MMTRYQKQKALSAFFSVDLFSLAQYENQGKKILSSVELDIEPQLGILSKLSITRIQGGFYFAEFSSEKFGLTMQLFKFIKTCMSLYCCFHKNSSSLEALYNSIRWRTNWSVFLYGSGGQQAVYISYSPNSDYHIWSIKLYDLFQISEEQVAAYEELYQSILAGTFKVDQSISPSIFDYITHDRFIGDDFIKLDIRDLLFKVQRISENEAILLGVRLLIENDIFSPKISIFTYGDNSLLQKYHIQLAHNNYIHAGQGIASDVNMDSFSLGQASFESKSLSYLIPFDRCVFSAINQELEGFEFYTKFDYTRYTPLLYIRLDDKLFDSLVDKASVLRKKEQEEREKNIIREKLEKKRMKERLKKEVLKELEEEEQNDERKRNYRPYIPKSVVDEVWRRDNGRCVYCGEQKDLHLDHIIPLSKGGASIAENLQILCQKCNLP